MNDKLKVVVFNAPPRLGKGVAAEHMIKLTNTDDHFYTAYHREFKDSLFKLCAAMYGVSVDEFLEEYDEESVKSPTGWCKDMDTFSINSDIYSDCNCWRDCHCGHLGVEKFYSQRSSLIHMSENIIKPVFGKDAFGKAMVASLPEQGIVFISDGGFSEELLPVIDHVGQDNVLVVKIHRKGVDFTGDSRAYLDNKDLGEKPVCMVDVDNDYTLEQFLANIEYVVTEWLN